MVGNESNRIELSSAQLGSTRVRVKHFFKLELNSIKVYEQLGLTR